MFSCEYCNIFKNAFVAYLDLVLLVYVQPFKNTLRVELTIFYFAYHENLWNKISKFYKIICVVPWLFIVQAHYSLFPKQLLLFSQISAEYSGVCQSQKNNPKIWSILNLLHLLTSYLFNKKNSSVAGVFKIMYLPPTVTEPRGGFRTLSSI